jgi:putative transposase
MENGNGYTVKNHGCFKMQAHIVLVCKYRRPLFINEELDQQMKNIMLDIANEKNFKITKQGTDVDHIHLLIEYDVNVSALSLVRVIKQISTFRIWRQEENHQPVLDKCFKNEKTFWTDGYFVCSVGQSNKDAVAKYIERQGKGRE